MICFSMSKMLIGRDRLEAYPPVFSDLEPDHLAGQNIWARTELNEFNLPFGVVENVRERGVHEIELRPIEAERDRELEFLSCSRCHERFVQFAIMREVLRVAVNRLLKIAHHA